MKYIIIFAVSFGLIIFSAKVTLERLIIDNYVKREMGLLPDKMYWADAIYMKYFYPIDHNSYNRIDEESLRRCGLYGAMNINTSSGDK